jgi:hypothetical protein
VFPRSETKDLLFSFKDLFPSAPRTPRLNHADTDNLFKALIMSFLSALRPFPEFTPFDEAIAAAAVANERDCSLRFDAYTSSTFGPFADAQPQAVATILSDIRQKVQDQVTAKRETIAVTNTFRRDVQPIKDLNSAIREDRKRHAAVQSVFERSSKEAEASAEKYDRLNAKSPYSPDLQKLKIVRDSLNLQRSKTEESAKQSEAKLAEKTKEYKKRLFTVILSGLGKFATGRKEKVHTQIEIAHEIEVLAGDISPYDDAGASKLREEIEKLKAIDP